MHHASKYVVAVVVAASVVQGLQLDTTSAQSIKDASSQVAYDIMSTYYTGNKTGGSQLLPKPYYWWESGALYGGLVDYWAYTNDSTYNENVGNAIVSQSSPTNDFMMTDQHFDLGNDDQAFWALTAMSALEQDFPIPSGTPADRWLQLTVNTFNDFVPRWNKTQCNGGLKWQIYTSNSGYDYKSSITNGGFFQLSARLARYTGNTTYSDWAETVYDWMNTTGLMDSATGQVFDGSGDLDNCAGVDHDEWSYNAAMMSYGSAVMWNVTAADKWASRTKVIVASASKKFFSPFSNATDIMFEQKCEKTNSCDVDQFSFKAYLSRWLGKTAVLIPDLNSTIMPLLTASAKGAAQSCVGELGSTCGTRWYTPGYDGNTGVGQQMSALETIQSLLVGLGEVKAPNTATGVKVTQMPTSKAVSVGKYFKGAKRSFRA